MTSFVLTARKTSAFPWCKVGPGIGYSNAAGTGSSTSIAASVTSRTTSLVEVSPVVVLCGLLSILYVGLSAGVMLMQTHFS